MRGRLNLRTDLISQWRWAGMKMQFHIVRKCDVSFSEICSGKTEQKIFSDLLTFWVNIFNPQNEYEMKVSSSQFVLHLHSSLFWFASKDPAKTNTINTCQNRYCSRKFNFMPIWLFKLQVGSTAVLADFYRRKLRFRSVSWIKTNWNPDYFYDIFSFWKLVILVINIKFFVRCVQIVFVNYISLDMPLFHRTDMETKLWYLSTETFFIFILFLIWNILYIKANYWHHHHDKVSWANMQHASCHVSFEFHKISFP